MKSHTAQSILDACYLETRAKLLEVAAVLDRIDRAAESSSPLPAQAVHRRDQIADAIQILLGDSANRAELIQQLFSRQFDPNWRAGFGLPIQHAPPPQSIEKS